MIRWSAIAAIGVGAAITMTPPSGTFAAGTTTTQHTTVARQAALAFLPARPRRTSRPRAGRAATDHVVNISSKCNVFCFVPEQTTVTVGDTVTWTNKTDAEHIVARCAPSACTGVGGGTGTDAAFSSAMLTMTPARSSHFTFTQPGTYVYYCTLHGYTLMHGTITVTAAAPATTTATAPASVPAATAPGVVAPAQPQLADTGAGDCRRVAIGFVLVSVGLTATTFERRRRHS